jgi:AAA domain-containing protein
MSLTGATLFIAIATTALAVGSGVTAWYAVRAFKKQSEAVADGQEMLGKQNEMLEVQSDRLEVYRAQVDDQRKINETYGEVLGLQAREIRASLEEREQTAEEERRSQAAKITAWLARSDAGDSWEARIRNASDLPIFDVRAFFHKIHRIDPTPGGGNWVPVGQVGTPRDEIICVFPPQTVGAPRLDRAAAARLLQADPERLVAALEGRATGADAAPTGTGLREDQAAAALSVLTDGRRVSVINAPAGAGKTRVLAEVTTQRVPNACRSRRRTLFSEAVHKAAAPSRSLGISAATRFSLPGNRGQPS